MASFTSDFLSSLFKTTDAKSIYDQSVEFVNSLTDKQLYSLSRNEIHLLSMLTYNPLYGKSHPHLLFLYKRSYRQKDEVTQGSIVEDKVDAKPEVKFGLIPNIPFGTVNKIISTTCPISVDLKEINSNTVEKGLPEGKSRDSGLKIGLVASETVSDATSQYYGTNYFQSPTMHEKGVLSSPVKQVTKPASVYKQEWNCDQKMLQQQPVRQRDYQRLHEIQKHAAYDKLVQEQYEKSQQKWEQQYQQSRFKPYQ